MKLDVSRCTLSSFFKCSLVLGSIVILQACDQQQVKPEQESQAASEEGVKISAANTKADVVTVSAKSLTQVAGQATLPAEADLNPATVPIGIYTISELCVKLKTMLFNLTSLVWISVLSNAITAL